MVLPDHFAEQLPLIRLQKLFVSHALFMLRHFSFLGQRTTTGTLPANCVVAINRPYTGLIADGAWGRQGRVVAATSPQDKKVGGAQHWLDDAGHSGVANGQSAARPQNPRVPEPLTPFFSWMTRRRPRQPRD